MYSNGSHALNSSIPLFTVTNVNISSPHIQVVQGLPAARVDINEAIFDINLKTNAMVVFSSNCTDSVTVNYSNPILILLLDTGLNTGLCQYSIQLVDDTSQQIGYPMLGFFDADSTSESLG